MLAVWKGECYKLVVEGLDEVILSLLGVSQISSCASASNKNNKVQPRGYTLINKWFQSPLACDAWGMAGGWNGMCPIGHKKWAWIWLCLKHRKIYLQNDEFTHSVSNGLRGWPSPQPERCVWNLKFKPVLLLARIMGWEHKHQNCPNYQQNSSLLQLYSFWLNECLIFFFLFFFSVFLFTCLSVSISSFLQTSPGSFPPNSRAALLTEYEWAPNALHLQKLIMHFMILIICNEKNRRKDEKGGKQVLSFIMKPFPNLEVLRGEASLSLWGKEVFWLKEKKGKDKRKGIKKEWASPQPQARFGN